MGRDGLSRNLISWLWGSSLYVRQRKSEKQKRRVGDAVGRGEISFGCDKEDMHVTRRNSIQQAEMETRAHTKNTQAMFKLVKNNLNIYGSFSFLQEVEKVQREKEMG